MKKFFMLCFSIVLMLSVFSPLTASAEEDSFVFDKVFAISRGGDTSLFPENSLEAFKSAQLLGFDAVSASVKKTYDGVYILFEEESTKGICVDENGKETDYKIEQTSYKNILSKLYLTSNGLKSDYKITLLDDAVNNIGKDMIIILDVPENIAEGIYARIKTLDAFDRVYIRIRDFSNGKIEEWAEKYNNSTPSIISRYKGNVIFSAISTYQKAEDSKYRFCEFSVKNLYGVIYSEFFTKRFNNTLALAPVYEKDLCGQRPDTVLGWENLLKLGYSAIETGNAHEFSKYLSLLNNSYIKLSQAVNEAKSVNADDSNPSYAEFSKRLDECKEILDSKHASSSDEINSAIEKLTNAADELTSQNNENKNSSPITGMKIFWIIFAVALFVSSQIYLKKKTVK